MKTGDASGDDGLERRVVEHADRTTRVALYSVHVKELFGTGGIIEEYPAGELARCGPYRHRGDVERQALELQREYSSTRTAFAVTIERFEVAEEEIVWVPTYKGKQIL